MDDGISVIIDLITTEISDTELSLRDCDIVTTTIHSSGIWVVGSISPIEWIVSIDVVVTYSIESTSVCIYLTNC